MGPNTQNQSSEAAAPRVPTPSATVHTGQQSSSRPVQQATIAPITTNPEPAQEPAPADQPLPSSKNLVLPMEIISRTHLSRCLREIEKVDDYFHQASIRGSSNQELPDVSRELDGLMSANGLNLLQADDRDKMKSFLARLKSKAPVVHMSFPSEAGSAFLGKLLVWYRREAHPYTVLHVGLQPELAAGCTVRTTNKQYDFSFRKRFEKSKSKLIEQLEVTGKQLADQAMAELQPALQQAVPATSVPAPTSTPTPAPTPTPTPAPTPTNTETGAAK